MILGVHTCSMSVSSLPVFWRHPVIAWLFFCGAMELVFLCINDNLLVYIGLRSWVTLFSQGHSPHRLVSVFSGVQAYKVCLRCQWVALRKLPTVSKVAIKSSTSLAEGVKYIVPKFLDTANCFGIHSDSILYWAIASPSASTGMERVNVSPFCRYASCMTFDILFGNSAATYVFCIYII